MKRGITAIAGFWCGAAGLSPVSAGQVYYPQPGLVDQSSGLMESLVNGAWYRGSAVIARDPKLLYSCAHLFYESGEWATDMNFYRACHQRTYPGIDEGQSPRGLHYFTSYSSGVKAWGTDSDEAFASDFTVLYAKSPFGNAVSWWSKGGSALRSNQPKRIVGYPSEIDFTGAPGRCYQHATPFFNYDAYRVLDSFNEFRDVSTGPGNSGGPIYVHDASSGNDLLAGILVSGTRKTAGVVALDLSTDTLASFALGLKEKVVSFTDASAHVLPDGTKSYTTIPIQVSGFSGAISKITLSLSVQTKRRGDLDIYLKSPGGRSRWVARHSGDKGDNLVISGRNLSSTFRGVSPNGIWKLKVRDLVPGNRANFQNATLRVKAF